VRQALGADVVEREVQPAAELGVTAQVSGHVAGELDASSANEGQLNHSSLVFHLGQFLARSCKQTGLLCTILLNWWAVRATSSGVRA
jgi:hypothetical protein